MKKLTIFALAALLLVAFTAPAWAVEHSIGGSWRVRFFNYKRFDGTEDWNAMDGAWVDQRLRIDWTAAINDNLKLVHRFEVGDLVWGQAGTTPGTDGVNVATSRSYIDFNLMPNWNWRIGIQPFVLNHCIFSCNDATGIITAFALSKDLVFGAFWMSVATSASQNAAGATFVNAREPLPFRNDRDATVNDMDIDVYGVNARIGLGNVTLTPGYYFAHSQAGYMWGGTGVNNPFAVNVVDNMNIHIFSLDADAQFGALSLAFTGMFNTGSVSLTPAGQAASTNAQTGPTDEHERNAEEDVSMRGWLMWMSWAYNFGMFDIHGQMLYASGDDQENNIAEGYSETNFLLPIGISWLGWSEIMGGSGFNDAWNSINSPGAQAQNLWFVGVGTTVRPMDKLSVSLDFWYAELVEDRIWIDEDGDWHKEDELGFEIDLKMTYQLIEGLNLDLVAAYLFAGDGTYDKTSSKGNNQAGWVGKNPPAIGTTIGNDAWREADPWKLGAMLSLSF
jgi:hypothetical protein